MRRSQRRIEVRLPLTHTTDVAFGIALRVPRRRARRRGAVRRWASTVVTAGCIAVAAIAPIATVAGARDLEQIGAILLAKPMRPTAAALSTDQLPRPVLRARYAPVTAVRADPPALGTHTVAAGESLLSIAAQHAITPQTLAYDNGLSDTADLRVGQSIVIPPFDAAIYVVRDGDSVSDIASRFGADADAVRKVNSVVYEPADLVVGRAILVPVPDGRYPGFRLRVSDAPRVLAPRVEWPTDGVVTQLFSSSHTGVDIAAPLGSPVVASDAGTITAVGWRGVGGLAVCVLHDWGLETCDYHLSATYVELGERVKAGERIAAVGSTGVSTGPHVHWEARTNGVLVDPLTYAPPAAVRIKVGGATGSP